MPPDQACERIPPAPAARQPQDLPTGRDSTLRPRLGSFGWCPASDAPAQLRGGRQLAAGLIGLPDRGRVGFGDDIYTTRVAIPLRRFFLLTG
jgi:hypothetical protein